MAKKTLSATEAKALAASLGIDWNNIDWGRIAQILIMILQALQQPQSMKATAGHEAECTCHLDCAAKSLEVAQHLLDCACECCPTPPTP